MCARDSDVTGSEPVRAGEPVLKRAAGDRPDFRNFRNASRSATRILGISKLGYIKLSSVCSATGFWLSDKSDRKTGVGIYSDAVYFCLPTFAFSICVLLVHLRTLRMK